MWRIVSTQPGHSFPLEEIQPTNVGSVRSVLLSVLRDGVLFAILYLSETHLSICSVVWRNKNGCDPDMGIACGRDLPRHSFDVVVFGSEFELYFKHSQRIFSSFRNEVF